MTSYAQGIADERERCARVALGPGDLGDEEAYYGRVIAEAIRNTGHAWDSRHGIPTLEAAATPQPPLVVPREREALPPLPTPWMKVLDADGVPTAVYRAFQMRDFARAALAGDQAEKDQA